MWMIKIKKILEGARHPTSASSGIQQKCWKWRNKLLEVDKNDKKDKKLSEDDRKPKMKRAILAENFSSEEREWNKIVTVVDFHAPLILMARTTKLGNNYKM